MVRLQHVLFKDWNPIGKPNRNKSYSSGNTRSGALDDAGFVRKKATENVVM